MAPLCESNTVLRLISEMLIGCVHRFPGKATLRPNKKRLLTRCPSRDCRPAGRAVAIPIAAKLLMHIQEDIDSILFAQFGIIPDFTEIAAVINAGLRLHGVNIAPAARY